MMRSTWICLATFMMGCFGVTADRRLVATETTFQRELANEIDTSDHPARRRSCILLWMPGGPSQTDTFDMKPGHENGGPFRSTPTSVPGIHISEHMPLIAKQMDRLGIQGGQVFGRSSPDGTEADEDPVGVPDLLATVMTNVTLLKHSVLTNALGSMVLLLLGAACSNPEEAHLVMIGDQTTLSIRMRLPNELVLRKATYADSKSAKLKSAIREWLDANQDNVLGSDELSNAEALLDRLDFDEDECLAPPEIAADLLTSSNSANSSQSVTSVLVRSADDTEGLVSLRRELDNHGRQGEEPVARVDATIDWDGNHDGAIHVRVEANSKARVERFTSSVGSTRFFHPT